MATKKAEKKSPKPYNWHTKLVSAVRKVWKYSPTRTSVLADAKDPDNPSHVICAKCYKSTHKKLATVEHLNPVVPVTGFDSWDAYIQRMQSDQLAVYCEACAKAKTKEENAKRAEFKKLTKAKGKK